MSNKHNHTDDILSLQCTSCTCSLNSINHRLYIYFSYAPMDSKCIIILINYSILWCNNTMPIHTPPHISDVQYSYFLCCTKFLLSVLYKIPIFSDVQYSCMSCCSFMMFNIPVFHVGGRSQMTSVERGREGVGQFLTKESEVA